MAIADVREFLETSDVGSKARDLDDVECLKAALDRARPALSTVNCWVFEGPDGASVVDTGVPGQVIADLWTEYVGERSNSRRPRKLLATHHHMDHLGQAENLVRQYDAEFMMTLPEWALGRMYALEPREDATTRRRQVHAGAGMADDDVQQVIDRAEANNGHYNPPVPAAFYELIDGETVELGYRKWQVFVGGGHSPAAATLYDEAGGLILSGDQVLPDISPFVGVDDFDPDGDPVGDYLKYLERMRALPEDALVLPGHGAPFRNMPRRAKALQAIHIDRLERALAASKQPITAMDILPFLFRGDTNGHMRSLFTVIAVAHLNYLVRRGVMERTTRGDGVLLYRSDASVTDVPAA